MTESKENDFLFEVEGFQCKSVCENRVWYSCATYIAFCLLFTFKIEFS